jgi:hypothetical protein
MSLPAEPAADFLNQRASFDSKQGRQRYVTRSVSRAACHAAERGSTPLRSADAEDSHGDGGASKTPASWFDSSLPRYGDGRRRLLTCLASMSTRSVTEHLHNCSRALAGISPWYGLRRGPIPRGSSERQALAVDSTWPSKPRWPGAVPGESAERQSRSSRVGPTRTPSTDETNGPCTRVSSDVCPVRLVARSLPSQGGDASSILAPGATIAQPAEPAPSLRSLVEAGSTPPWAATFALAGWPRSTRGRRTSTGPSSSGLDGRLISGRSRFDPAWAYRMRSE